MDQVTEAHKDPMGWMSRGTSGQGHFSRGPKDPQWSVVLAMLVFVHVLGGAASCFHISTALRFTKRGAFEKHDRSENAWRSKADMTRN